jgi:predicted membrane-bound spermidine synthase
VILRNRALFLAFFVSGFCGLLYQIVWLRLAFARFGVITPVLSVVISVFMLGLSIGSFAAGRWTDPLSTRFQVSPLRVYALTEALIGCWGILVPTLFQVGSGMLLSLGETSSAVYLFQSAVAITMAILPGCVLMGATFPLVAAYLRAFAEREPQSFSFLYLANVMGAMCGALLTALFIIELIGFRGALLVGMGLNWFVAGLSLWLDGRCPSPLPGAAAHPRPAAASEGPVASRSIVFAILFITGFSSMGMEVAWTRAFTPIVKTTIYAFAFLLASYLLATWTGSLAYRRQLTRGRCFSTDLLLWWLAAAAFLPLLFNDPRFQPTVLHVFAGLFPVCAVLGYLTPKLIDEHSGGAPRALGLAYATNVVGCILGPLVAAYVLLPTFGVKWTLIGLALPFVALCLVPISDLTGRAWRILSLAVLALAVARFTHTYEDGRHLTGRVVVRRDHTATVTSTGGGASKQLLVNGIGMTGLSPVTKVMAHLPLVTLPRAPERALAICFGMGTTFRSLLSWNIEVTAVELVPSVRDAFGYYFADAARVMANPKAHVVIDDGRRYLSRTEATFDVITIDPPPPIEAAGSSLLYSAEFYQVAKSRLKSDGILQQWFPQGDPEILGSVAAALKASFSHVRVFRSIEGWGFHFLASDRPISSLTAEQALTRMPESARRDLMEWFPRRMPLDVLGDVLRQERSLDEILGARAEMILTDDHPYNEYFLVRRLLTDALGRAGPAN